MSCLECCRGKWVKKITDMHQEEQHNNKSTTTSKPTLPGPGPDPYFTKDDGQDA